MVGMMREERHVVTNFLEFEGKILLLRRSNRVSTYKGQWAGISGYVEEDPDRQALIEIKEETGLGGKEVQLVKKGEPLEVVDEELGRRWVVHPYRWQVMDPGKVKIDWEHREMKWINPQYLSKYQTVPKLQEAWEKVSHID